MQVKNVRCSHSPMRKEYVPSTSSSSLTKNVQTPLADSGKTNFSEKDRDLFLFKPKTDSSSRALLSLQHSKPRVTQSVENRPERALLQNSPLLKFDEKKKLNSNLSNKTSLEFERK